MSKTELDVLVVDDSAVMRGMIVKALHSAGYAINNVYEAENGVEALKHVEHHKVDLATVDVSMPVMDGVNFVKALRNNPRTAKTPVVVVSAGNSNQRTKEFEGLDAAYVQKPFSAERMRGAVESALGVTHDCRFEDRTETSIHTDL
jgi:two-component system chemotaxis response regulator CheY